MTREDVADLLQAFGASGFTRMELVFGRIRLAVNRARPGVNEVAAPRPGFFQARVQPGSEVRPDTTIGIIRALDEQTEVKAAAAGSVADVVARDGEFVEYGEPLARLSTDSR